MNISIKATGLELTPALQSYISDKLQPLERYLPSDVVAAATAAVEVGKTTNHHKGGDVFRSEINLDYPGVSLRTVAQEEDLYAAIDVSKNALANEIRETIKKKSTLLKRGGRLLKKLFHGNN